MRGTFHCGECGETTKYKDFLDACPHCGHDLPARNYKQERRARRKHFRQATWPMESDAAGVHPSQIEEARAHSIAHGVPTEFTPASQGEHGGKAIFTSRKHRRDYLRICGLHDNHGGYGD